MNRRHFVNSWFWRTYDQKEVDYIEEEGGLMTAFEFKYKSSGKNKVAREFLETYQGVTFKTVTRENFQDILS
jgi:predicted AAA+ superfamily ATPase